MDGFLGKFGIYDFMGIWGPGAITVTYFYFTMKKNITMFLNFIGIVNPDISENYLLLILYTIPGARPPVLNCKRKMNKI